MKRTTMYITESQTEKLSNHSESTGAQVAEIVRQAIDMYFMYMDIEYNQETISELRRIHPQMTIPQIIFKVLTDDRLRREFKNTKEQNSELLIRLELHNRHVLGEMCSHLGIDCPEDSDLMDELAERGYKHVGNQAD